MSRIFIIIPLVLAFSILVWNVYLPITSYRNIEFVNYISYVFTKEFQQNSFIQQYLYPNLLKPIQNFFSGFAAGAQNNKVNLQELGPRILQDMSNPHYVALTFYVQYGNHQQILDLLDLLDQYHIKNAQFFFEKRFMNEHEFVVKRIQYSGYEIKPWATIPKYDNEYAPSIYENKPLTQKVVLGSSGTDAVAKNFLYAALHYQPFNIVALTPQIMSHKMILEELLKENGNGLIFVDDNKMKNLNTNNQNTDQNTFNKITYNAFSTQHQASSSNPPQLVISTGTWTMDSLQKKYPFMIDRLGPGNHFLVSKPIIISKGAELNISNSTLFLQTSSGIPNVPVFIEVLGRGSLIGSKVTSWDTTINQPSSDPYHPRPFITVINGGKMDIINSTLSHLGYSTGGTNDVGNGRSAIEYYNTNRFIVANSSLAFNYRGIYTANASNFKVVGNQIYGQSAYGINLQARSANFSVDRNHIHDNGNQAILCFFECRNAMITNNIVDHNAGGIVLHSSSNSSTVKDNVVKYNSNYGVLIQKYSSNNVVDNNKIQNNMIGMGLLEGSNHNSVINNVISRNFVNEIIRVSPGSNLNFINKNLFE